MTPAVVLAAVLSGLTAASLFPAPSRRPGAHPGDSLARVARGLVVVATLVAGFTGWTFLPVRTFVLAAILALTGLAVLRMLRRRAAAAAADQRSAQVLAACEALASDLTAGQPPLLCLDRAAAEWSELAPVAAAGRMGADVPDALRDLAARPGGGQLRTLAASWAVAHRTGAGLALAIHRAAESIRAERRTARLVASELASARATARMLAVLPLGVLLLGSGIGGDPVGFLVGTTGGLGCLAVGLALSLAGMRWLDAIADRVLRR